MNALAVERYVDKSQAMEIAGAVRTYVDGSDPDGTITITKDALGFITGMSLTYDGGVRTTTYSESNGVKTIVERDVKTGADKAKVVTTTIQNNQATKVTTYETISNQGGGD